MARRALTASASAPSPRRQAARMSWLAACHGRSRCGAGRWGDNASESLLFCWEVAASSPLLCNPHHIPAHYLQLPLRRGLHLRRSRPLLQLRFQPAGPAFSLSQRQTQLLRLALRRRHLPLCRLPATPQGRVGWGGVEWDGAGAVRPPMQNVAQPSSMSVSWGEQQLACKEHPLQPAVPRVPAGCRPGPPAPPRQPPAGPAAAAQQEGRGQGVTDGGEAVEEAHLEGSTPS